MLKRLGTRRCLRTRSQEGVIHRQGRCHQYTAQGHRRRRMMKMRGGQKTEIQYQSEVKMTRKMSKRDGENPHHWKVDGEAPCPRMRQRHEAMLDAVARIR